MSLEIVAEIAQGFEGNPKLANLLARAGVAAGADAVKFQLVYADELAVKTYQYYDLFKSLEMDIAVWKNLVEYVQGKGVRFYFDVYGEISLGVAKELGADGVKISTADFYNIPLIESALGLFNKLYFSIGGVPQKELEDFVARFPKGKDITLMHGFQAEPTLLEDNNLSRIGTLKSMFPACKIGFMDHSLGVSVESMQLPFVALGAGASCIEKHISLDPLLEIEDFISALTPSKFSEFSNLIRRIYPSLGLSDLTLNAKEVEYKNRAGKVVVANRIISKGTTIERNMLSFKRISTNGSLNCFRKHSDVIGKIVKRDLCLNQPVTIDDI